MCSWLILQDLCVLGRHGQFCVSLACLMMFALTFGNVTAVWVVCDTFSLSVVIAVVSCVIARMFHEFEFCLVSAGNMLFFGILRLELAN